MIERMVVSSTRFVLGVVALLVLSTPIQVQVVSSFVLPASLSKQLSASSGAHILNRGIGTKSALAYGIRDDGDDEKELASSAPFPTNDFQEQLNNELDPACSIDDEDCLAFSSLDDQPLMFNSDTNEDPLCDPQDVDCQAFLPGAYLHSDSYLATELKTRSNSIEMERVGHNWRTAHCPTTFVSISNSDWVRRVHMQTYPIAVCGGARGGIYVVNLEEKNVIGQVGGAHIVQVDQQGSGSSNPSGVANTASAGMARQAMNKLYGKLDGGGVVAIAIHGDLVASSGREGGARLWKVVSDEENGIIPLGAVPGLENTIVTSLKFDSNDLLWTGCYDGTVSAFDITTYESSRESVGIRVQCQSDFTDSVMDMHLCEELGLGVCATADGSAALFNMENGQFFVGIMLFDVAARSVMIMKHKDGAGYSVLCGGASGIIHRIPLNIDPATGRVDEDNPFMVSETTDTAIKPRHVGPVMCMSSPADGIFISGGQDGALRVWDCSGSEAVHTTGDGIDGSQEPIKLPKCMYALTGYKLWLGSVCTDGKRLVSDGGENSVIIRDFSSQETGTNGKASL